MIWNVKYTDSDKAQVKKSDIYIRQGTEVYRHPKGHFVTLEFQGKGGTFKESFFPKKLMKVGV